MTINKRFSFITRSVFWYYAIMLAFGALYYTIAIADHYYFRTTAFDYGTYNFAFWDYSHFQLSKCPVYTNQNMNFLQDHFSLTLMYFVPVYWLLNWLTGTYTLVLIQVTSVLIGGWATYRFIIQKTNDAWLGIAALLYYFLLQGHFSMFVGDCNVAVISAAFIPLFLYYFECKKYVLATVFFVLALLSRENIPLWFISILPIVMLWHRKEKKIIRLCLWFMLAAAFYFVLLFKVIIPGLETAEKQYSIFNYSTLGATPFEAVKHIFQHPFNSFKMIFFTDGANTGLYYIKKEFYLVYFISGGFMLFYRPQYFIWFIPLLAQKMLNDQPIRWSIEWHYAIEVVTMLPLAVFVIIADQKNKKWRYASSIAVCFFTLAITCYKMGPKKHAIPGYGVVKENIFSHGFFNSGFDTKRVNDDLKQIPSDAEVSASASILPHLAQRKYIYEFPKVNDAEYMAVLANRDYFEVSDSEYTQSFCKYLFNPNWNIMADDYPFMLFKRAENMYNSNYYDTIVCNAEALNSNQTNVIASNNSNLCSATIRSDTRAHSGKYSLLLGKNNTDTISIIDSNVTENDYICASVWRVSTNKDNGELIVSYSRERNVSSHIPYNKMAEEVILNGWQQIVLYFKVPPNCNRVKISAVSNTGEPVWFDDLKVIRFKTGCK